MGYLGNYPDKETLEGNEKLLAMDEEGVKKIPIEAISDEDKVSKSGDVMTGQLTLEKGSINAIIGNGDAEKSGYVEILRGMTIKNWGGVPITFKVLNQVDMVYLVTLSPSGGSTTSTTLSTVDVLPISSNSTTTEPVDFIGVNEGNGTFSVWMKIRYGYDFVVADLSYDKEYYSVVLNSGKDTDVKTFDELSHMGILVRMSKVETGGGEVPTVDVMVGATATTAGKAGLVPAPEAEDNVRYLNGAGEYEYLGTLYSQREVPSEGWYRFVKRIGKGEEPSFGCESGVIQLRRAYSTLDTESYILTFTSAWKNKMNFHCIGRYVNAKGISKLRFAKDAEDLYLEIYYTGERQNTIMALTMLNANSSRQWLSVDFEPATEDETVVSEYIIPDKDDFDTSKSLTRGTKILDNSDLKSDMYCIPGNYYSGDSNAIAKYTNRPPQLTSAFRLYVSYGVNDDYYIQQRFEDLLGRVIVVRTKYGRSSSASWSDEYVYYPSVGSPGANKLWGTDANGRIGWIDPPLASRVTALESKSDHILVGSAELSQNGWYLLCQFTNYYTDMIIMLHKAYNESVSNGVILSFTNQHSDNSANAFNILNHSGSGAIKKIAVVTYESKTYLAMNFSRTTSGAERLSSLIFWNLSGSYSVYNRNFTYIGSAPSNFTIVTEKTLST